MGFRFRKARKLFPGVNVTLSKSGLSTSLGVKGARVTLGKKGVTQTVGIPGTGISHTSSSGDKKGRNAAANNLADTEETQTAESASGGSALVGIIVLIVIGYFIYKVLT